MTFVRAIRRARAAVALGVVGVTGAVLMAIVSWQRLWSSLGNPDAFFGGDLVAYIEAAKRLTATGSPYHAAVLAGPIENIVANVPIGYLYPPPLAQLFVPLVDLPHLGLAWVWFATQAVAIVLLAPLVWRAAGGTMSPPAAMALAFVLLSSWPLAFALFGGNVSAWIAIGVAVMLVARGRVAGAVAASLALLKLTPSPLLIVAIASRAARLPAALTAVAVGLVSIALSPGAWTDWIRALPNIARNPPSSGTANLSPTAAGSILGWPEAGLAVGLALTIGFGFAALIVAVRSGLTLPTISAATFAYLFASPTLWDHHAAAAVPLMVGGWPGGNRATRLVILANVAWAPTIWIGFHAPVVTLLLLVMLGLTLVVPAVVREVQSVRAPGSAGRAASPEDSAPV